MAALALARGASAKITFGTDLLGSMQTHQADEFVLRGALESPAGTIRSATIVAAELLGVADPVGRIEQGYAADIIAVDADPFIGARVTRDPAETPSSRRHRRRVRFSRLAGPLG